MFMTLPRVFGTSNIAFLAFSSVRESVRVARCQNIESTRFGIVSRPRKMQINKRIVGIVGIVNIDELRGGGEAAWVVDDDH